ncbi:MAG: hypothetical protein NTX17_07530 [Candidatus Eisenbacteria bacterium]|nr:hypothetical protein [Candidatus Eisenbacteria bacterium]
MSGSLEKYGAMKAYVFLVDAEDTTTVTVVRSSGFVEPLMELYGPSDSLIVSVGGSSSSQISDSYFKRSGMYTLYISDYGSDEIGSYELRWSGVLAGGLIRVASIIEPSGVVSFSPSIVPKALLTNIGWEEQTFAAKFTIYNVYSDSLVDLSLSPGESDTLSFTPWTPTEPAAYFATCSTQAEGGLVRSENRQAFSLTSGVGPEIYSRTPGEAANRGMATVTITGRGFEPGTTASLENTVGGTVFADTAAVQFVSPQEIRATFDLTGAVPGTWNLRVTNPDNDSYIFYEGFTISGFPGQEIAFGSWEEFSVGQARPTQIGVNVPDGVDNLYVLMKKTTHIGYSDTWTGSMKLFKDGVQVALASGSGDFDVHLQTPQYGWYTLEVSATGSGEGLVKVCAALDSLQLGQWKIGQVLRPYGCDWGQVDVPPSQASLFFETEGFGLWSTLDVYQGYLGNRSQHWQFSNMGAGYHIEGVIQNPAAGRYYLRYMDSAVMEGVGGQAREYMIIADTVSVQPPPASAPTITDVSSYKGGTFGFVTLIISGASLAPRAIVSLVRDGYSSVAATYVSGDSTMRGLTVTFDLSATPAGEWRLEVANPDGEMVAAPQPFVVEAGGQPDMWVKIVGREQLRVGRYQRYVIKYGNTGNVDAIGVPLWIAFPASLIWKFDTPIAPPTPREGEEPFDWSRIPISIEYDSETRIPLLLPLVPPGCDGTIEIELMVPGATLAQGFDLSVWLNRPLFNPLPIILLDPRQAEGSSRIPHVPVLGGPWWSSDWYQCIVDLGTALIKFPPGWDCLYSWGNMFVMYELERYRARIGAPQEPQSLIQAFTDMLAECCDEFSPGNPRCAKLELYNDLKNLVLAVKPGSPCEKTFSKWYKALLHILFASSVTPEDKCGLAGYDPDDTPPGQLRRFVPTTDALTYRIDFWNKEDATAPAQEVFVLDTLSTGFVDSTFAFNEFGFLRWTIPLEGGQYFNINVDMRPDKNSIVSVEGRYNQSAREVSWTFRSLDPATGEPPEDPMEGFMPPMTDSGYEIGWVDFTVKPRTDLPSGTRIANQAFVNFDGVGPWNPAPKDGPYINTVDVLAPTSHAKALGATQPQTSFNVCISGQDEEHGSGIARYLIYVSDNGAEPELWLATQDSTVTYRGESGHTYRFKSVAEDNVGNRELPHLDYDAVTTVNIVPVMAVSPSPFVPARGHTNMTFFGEKVRGSEIKIFNKAGEHIKTLEVSAGQETIIWDGKSEDGKDVASGVYVWVLRTPSGEEHRGKFAIIR